MKNHNEERYPGNQIHITAVIADGVKMGTGNKIGAYSVIGAPAEWKGREKEGWVEIGSVFLNPIFKIWNCYIA